jgi:hypothetical protein
MAYYDRQHEQAVSNRSNAASRARPPMPDMRMETTFLKTARAYLPSDKQGVVWTGILWVVMRDTVLSPLMWCVFCRSLCTIMFTEQCRGTLSALARPAWAGLKGRFSGGKSSHGQKVFQAREGAVSAWLRSVLGGFGLKGHAATV